VSEALPPRPRASIASRPEALKAIDRAAATRPLPGNRVTLLQDGPEVYPAMLEIIERAQRFVHFENYIFRSDATGWRFAKALAERAERGVPVRVLCDWLGSLGTSRRLWRYLRTAGCEVRGFNPPSFLHPLRSISRDHRKLVVADGRQAIVGGLCIGDEWAGENGTGVPPWRDTAVLIEGPACQALDLAFDHVWSLTGPPLPAQDHAGEAPEAGEAAVWVVAGVPGRERAARVFEYLVAGARRRVWIADAYFVPTPRLYDVLATSERDGVDVRILLPGTSDLPVVRNLSRLGYRDMLRAGIRIFEWNGPMIHGKTLAADTRWARVGTSNLNAVSLIGNYELDILIEDPALARAMEQQFRRDLAGSVEVVRQPRNVPSAFSRMVPSRLAREGGEQPGNKRRGRRELRARTVVAWHRLASGALRSLFGPMSLVLAVLGGLAVAWPRVMGYVFGGLCLWLAIPAALQAWRRREPL